MTGKCQMYSLSYFYSLIQQRNTTIGLCLSDRLDLVYTEVKRYLMHCTTYFKVRVYLLRVTKVYILNCESF